MTDQHILPDHPTFAIGPSSLGLVLVAAGADGVIAILLGDAADPLEHEFRARFPATAFVRDDAGLAALTAAVIGFIEAPRGGWALPMDLRGTAFQRLVWQALRDIPVGTTATYADVARRIGAPKAMRAVAGACAANALAVAIPCHRVIRTDGSLSGYRWGTARKQALLAREAQA
jgi:AraC family transcriptional regulator of adaptative response/methylated-DNA-[protein]-cysteine methyltransferase